MKNLRKTRNEGGITLIALVVTIIILLILAGVTLGLVLSDGGLIDKTKEAISKHEEVQEKEQEELGKVTGMLANALDGLGSTGGTSVDRTGIHIGDYIDYKPDGIDAEEIPTYEATKLGETYTGSTKNTDIEQDRNMKWQVLKIYDNGEIDIIGTPTSTVYFTGATGYNNGVYILNDICKTLYSRKEDGIYARSVSSEDFERAETKDEDGKTAREKYISDTVGKLTEDGTYITKVDKENNTVTYSKNYSWYPKLYTEENGSGINGDGIKSNGLKEYESKKENGAPVITSIDAETNQKTQAESLTTTYTYYQLEINANNYGDASNVLKSDDYYCIASRFVECSSYSTRFGLRIAAITDIGCLIMFYSNGTPDSDDYYGGLRPVVHLRSNVQIELSKSDATNPETPHNIKSYN